MDVTVSVAIIVKNEQRCIKRCITSLIDAFDEVIIVDTGSTDNTINCINEFDSKKIKLFHLFWNDDFSEPRNFAIKKSNNDYIFFIDADEYLLSPKDKIHSEFMSIHDVNTDKNLILSPVIKDHNNNVSSSVIRGFFNDKDYYYFGFVHEELRHKTKKELIHHKLDIVLGHDGYMPSILTDKNKEERNRILNIKNMQVEPCVLRWRYFYFRDDFKCIDPKEIYFSLANMIKERKDEALSLSNLRYDRYTFSILDIMAQSKLKLLDSDEEFREIINAMNVLMPNNSNCVYYSSVYELLKWKIKAREKVNLLLGVKSNICNEDMLHSEGLHIDSILAIYMFESGITDAARKLMLSVQGSGFNTELMTFYMK